MRKWQDLAAPDDPGSWYAVGNMWPTIRGTYETADGSTATTASSGTTFNGVAYAFHHSRNAEYVWLSSGGTGRVYSWDGTNFTNVTPAAFGGTGWAVNRGSQCMVRFGDVTLACTSTMTSPAKIHGGSFGTLSEISSAPTARNILVVQSLCVLAFSTEANTYHTTDVGDYTNWSTGEATNNIFYQLPGNVSAALAYGPDVFVFKPTGILRMTYVGGVTKWQVQIAWKGVGIPKDLTGTLLWPTNDWAVATRAGIVFYGGGGKIYLFDGASAPVCINPLTTIPVETLLPVFTYDPQTDIVCVASSFGSNADGQSVVDSSSTLVSSLNYYYCVGTGQWGTGYGSAAELESGSTGVAGGSGVMRGEGISQLTGSPKPVYWYGYAGVSGYVKRCYPSSPPASATCFLQTAKAGRADRKTFFDRLTPLLRRRTDLGTDSASLELTLFREREDTSAQTTRTISESSTRKRFDLTGGASTDNFARFKVTWTALDVEVDDFQISSKDAGTD